MEIITALVIAASVIIIIIEVIGIKKAAEEQYDSKWITMYRGWNVAALLKEKDVQDERVKRLLIINNGVNILLVFALIYYYFISLLSRNYSFELALVIPLINFITRKLVDGRIKKVIVEQTDGQTPNLRN